MSAPGSTSAAVGGLLFPKTAPVTAPLVGGYEAVKVSAELADWQAECRILRPGSTSARRPTGTWTT